jgi:hypothetical protein
MLISSAIDDDDDDLKIISDTQQIAVPRSKRWKKQ